MHILLIPDSFKDSISAIDIIAALDEGFTQLNAGITTEHCVASDGGEGFLDFIQRYVSVDIISCKTVDPLGREIMSDYALSISNPVGCEARMFHLAKTSKTAYIELAKASGLEQLKTQERNPMHTSTYGTGLQIQDAIQKGAQEIIVGLGGSATNDGGAGIAQALGYTFLDANGQELKIKGGVLNQIKSIKKPALTGLPKLYAVNDVNNILTGAQGAAHTYGKQKGASPEEIKSLDNGLVHLAEIVKKDLQHDEAHKPGSGAAGGTSYGLKVFGKATYITGVDFLAKVSGISQALAQGKIDLIITGEGSIDHQTYHGKLVKGVAALGVKYGIPVIALCGINELDEAGTQSLGLQKVFALTDSATSKEDSIKNAKHYIKAIANEIYAHTQEH